MTTLAELKALILAHASKPRQMKNDKISVQNYTLKELQELYDYFASLEATSSAATQVDAQTALMPGVRTNTLQPPGSI